MADRFAFVLKRATAVALWAVALLIRAWALPLFVVGWLARVAWDVFSSGWDTGFEIPMGKTARELWDGSDGPRANP